MAPMISFAGVAAADKWTDFYARNRNDGGPFQTLFETNVATMARKTESHLNNVTKLSETITGSDYRNILSVPGRKGTMQLLQNSAHHLMNIMSKMAQKPCLTHVHLGINNMIWLYHF